jgi:hypothetical protein
MWQSLSADGGRTWSAAVRSNAWSVFPGAKTLPNGATVLVSGRPGLGMWLLLDADAARWKFYNLAAEHNRACGPVSCGVNSTYDDFTAGIVNATTTIINGSEITISPDRDRDHATPPMTKAYLGLEEVGTCVDARGGPDQSLRASSCDVIILYDRDCNGGEGPDCPMCEYQHVHGDEDRVYAMRVSIAAR